MQAGFVLFKGYKMRLKTDKTSARDTREERRKRSWFGSSAIRMKSRKTTGRVTLWDGTLW